MKHIYTSIYNSLSTFVLFLCLSVLVSSCERRPLEEAPIGDTALLTLHIDWSKSNLEWQDPSKMQHAELWVYPQPLPQPSPQPQPSSSSSSEQQPLPPRVLEPIHIILEGRSLTDYTVSLPVGKYSILLYNEPISRGSNDGLVQTVSFRGLERWDTAEAYVDTPSPAAAARSEVAVLTPSPMASWSLECLEVTQAMVTRTRTKARSRASSIETRVDEELEKLKNITPLPITQQVAITARVANLIKAYDIRATISGATVGVLLASRATVQSTTAHYLTLNNRTYDNPNKKVNGAASNTISTFGLNNASTLLDMHFVLVDNSELDFKFDVSDQVTKPTTEGNVSINVGNELVINPDDPDRPKDKPIELPEVIGDNVNVGDWDDGGNIDIL